MRNITIALDEETARWTRIAAAHLDVSVSRFVGDLLKERHRHQGEYEAAMHSYLSRSAHSLRKPGERYPKREEIYDRKVLR